MAEKNAENAGNMKFPV